MFPQVQPANAPFLPFSTCVWADFLHPKYAEVAQRIGVGLNLHRKNWEWVYIAQKLAESGCVGPGKVGLGFGVGGEVLTADFASAGAHIVATDAPVAIGEAGGWTGGDQLAGGIDSIPKGGMDPALFLERVSFRRVDMNNIDPDLQGFDFLWSSCAFEHLGSLRKGLEFVLESTERLKPGGVAVHTTEFNVESNDATIDNSWCVLYRLKDIQWLAAELAARGHTMAPFVVGPQSTEIDRHIDMPPYLHDPHLKLMLEGHITTSCGIVVTRGS